MKQTRFVQKTIAVLSFFAVLFFPIREIPVATAETSEILTISNMESDWTKLYHLGDYRYDFRDAAEGKGSLVLLPDNIDGFAGVATSFYPMNLSLHGFRFFIKSNDWDLVYTLVITFHTYGDWNDYFVFDMVWNLNEKPDNEWIEVVLSPGEFTKVGNPSWQNITKVTFRTDVNPGKQCEVKIDGLSCFFNQSNPAISIVFDDGHLSTMRAKKVMDEYGIAGTLFVIPSYRWEPEFVDQAMIDTLHEDGWDIGGHGDTVLTELSEQELQDEFLTTKRYLDEHQYRGRDIYALPYGVYNQKILETGRQYFRWLRPNDSLNQPSGYVPACRINTRSVSVFTPVDSVKKWIDQAKENDDWIILVFHHIDDAEIYDTDYSEASFRAIIEYAIDRELPILPMSEYLDRYQSG